ncbi:uncharacterized protein LOC110981288 isoform X2 [Acanthaster planci]|nr:uncharacterized protein LOC110981288 isoform X2 [Acanthaster planci]XP_022094449.1 uncharacterized protein LOC110981288 isoform X2 [Acanthaster planci]
MLSLSKAVSRFPGTIYTKDVKPKLTNLHLKHGWTSESEPSSSSESESDLPNPRSFLFTRQRVRAASPILVELYPPAPAKGCKREVDPSSPTSPPKKNKVVQRGVSPLAESNDRTKGQRKVSNISTLPEKPVLKNLSKPLLTLSDFSDSEDEFEPCGKRFVHTPSKQSWLTGTSPHKTANLGLPQRCRKEDRPMGPPVHITVPDIKKGDKSESSVTGSGKNKSLGSRTDSKVILDFCRRQRDIIEAVVEESFIDDAIIFIRDFATLHRGAPEEYMMYLLKDVLLADGMEDCTVLNGYEALVHIRGLHPTAATSLTVDWDLLTTIVKKLNLGTRSEGTQTPRLAHVLALQFVVIVLTEDFQAARARRKSCAQGLLSADMCLAHVRTVIQWLCQTVTNKLAPCPTVPEPQQEAPHEDRNVWQFLRQITKDSNSKPDRATQIATRTMWSEGYLTVLHLFQKLVFLSYAVGKSNSALKIAEEFLYPYLYIPSLDLRKICLQTLTCDPVRSKLIELLLENLCEQKSMEQQGVLSIHKMVTCHFRSGPMRISEFVLAERDVHVGDRRKGWSPSNGMQERRMDECEELAMLLFCLLQSYIRNKTAQSLQTGSKGVQSSQCCDKSSRRSGLYHPAAEAGLSMEDRECLLQMGDHVEVLEACLRDHCDRLTPRTRLYLAQIESMRELA